MDYNSLGNTGLTVSVAGLGCGGFSRLGRNEGKSEQQAMDLGINFIDTARTYVTEHLVGEAIHGQPRDGLVLSTKTEVATGKNLHSPSQVEADLEESLRQLQVDYIGLFLLHGVVPATFEHALNNIVPSILRQREKGKIRFGGITESPPKIQIAKWHNRHWSVASFPL